MRQRPKASGTAAVSLESERAGCQQEMETVQLNQDTLMGFLRRHSSRAKTVYRPLICPFDELLPHVPLHSQVLDIGCGGGAWMSLIAGFREPSRLDGMDPDTVAADEARLLLGKVSPRCPWSVTTGDLHSFARPVSEYDVVTMVDVLHHIPPAMQWSTLAELHHSMKPGALLILKDIDRASPLVLFNKLHDLLLAGEIGFERSADAAASELARLQFEVTAKSHRRLWWYPHYTIVARRAAN